MVSEQRIAIHLLITALLMFTVSACGIIENTGKTRERIISPVVLTNCKLVDGNGGEVIENTSISLREGKIENIGTFPMPDDARVIDAGGRYVMPGFINAHVHLAYKKSNLKRWLKAGVTTVRDLDPIGINNFTQMRDSFNTDPANTTVVSASPIITAVGGYGFMSVDSPEQAEKVVRYYIENVKVDQIKFALEDFVKPYEKHYNMLTEAEAKIIVKTAHEYNIKTSVHVTHAYNLELALVSDADDFAHMVFEPVEPKMIKKIIDAGVYWIPTFEIFDRYGSDVFKINIFPGMLKNLENFRDAGGKIAFGTDFGGIPGVSFDKGFPITEVRVMKKAGMSNMEIIVAATKNSAFVCDRDREIGTIEKGKQADILIVDGNPLDDIENLKNTWMVIHKGYIAVEH